METRSTNTYQTMSNHLHDIANRNCIDLDITNLFEDFIIEILAKISQRAHACQFGRYDERYTYVAAAMDFNAATLTQLLALNDQFTGLELLDVTTEAHDRITRIPSEILDHPHFIIRMNSAIIDSEILPRLKKYLQLEDHDDFAREFKIRYLDLTYTETAVQNALQTMFIPQDISIYLFDNDLVQQSNRAVVDTICELTKENLEPTKNTHEILDTRLLPPLASVVNHYAYGGDNLLDAKFQTLATTAYSELRFFDQCPDIDSGYLHLYFYTCLILEIPAASALAIHNFLNTFSGPRACRLGKTTEIKQENKTIECQTLWVRNSMLADPEFLSKMKTHNQRTEKLDQYHKQTALEFAKHLNDLSQKEIPPTHPLSTSIARLTAHIKEHPLEKRDDTDEYFKTVQDDAKNFRATDSTQKLFSKNVRIANKVSHLLKALTKIMEKQFHPLACKKSGM